MRKILVEIGLLSTLMCLSCSIYSQEVTSVTMGKLKKCTNHFQMPESVKLKIGKVEVNDYQLLKSHVDVCTDISVFNENNQKQLILPLGKIKDQIAERIKSIADNEKGSFDVEFLQKTKQTLIPLLNKVESAISTMSVTFFSTKSSLQQLTVAKEESVKLACRANYPTITFLSVTTFKSEKGKGENKNGSSKKTTNAEPKAKDVRAIMEHYQVELATYVEQCKEAVNLAVRNNNSEELALVRGAIKNSIHNIIQSPNQLGNALYQKRIEVNESLDFNQKIQQQLTRLKQLAEINSKLPLLANWRSYPFTNQFYVGVESNKVSGFSENSNARLGLLTYYRPGRRLQYLRSVVGACTNERSFCGGFFAWPHWYFSASYSSSAEQSGTNEDEKIEPSLDWETGIFLPVYVGIRGEDESSTTETMFGLIYSRGGRDVGDSEKFLNRYYRGLRLAFNEESYFDVMRGSSEGIEGSRWEVRGQFPVSEFGSGRLFVGGNVNFGHDDRETINTKDSYKVYVMWQTSFDDLWSRSEN